MKKSNLKRKGLFGCGLEAQPIKVGKIGGRLSPGSRSAMAVYEAGSPQTSSREWEAESS